MAKLLFDVNRQLDVPTLILETKSGKRYGSLDGITGLKYKRGFINNPREISFNISKYINGKINPLWDNITDLKTIYIPEYDEDFEIEVNYSDDELETKSVTGIDLSVAELSQTIIRGLEVNTDSDLESNDYNLTTFYNSENEDLSLLHRILNPKCSHYTIAHVDKTLCDLAFEFTADEKSVYDFLTGDVAEKMQCLFLFDSRKCTIEVYDLCSTCNDCYEEIIGKSESEWKHYRDDFHNFCPKCGSTNIIEGYGKDTTILIDKENLATSITRETDVDSLKNCLHVSGGDDLIDAAFIMSNPNGSQYIYRFTDEQMEEMPEEFKKAYNDYTALYGYYNTEHNFSASSSLISSFDNIIKTISSLSDSEPYINYSNHITPTLKGMKSLVIAYYNAVDLNSFIQTSMCPSYEVTEYDKYEALSMLNSQNIGTVAVVGLDDNTTKTVIDNAVLLVAKTLVNTAMYDVDIVSSTYSSGMWNGIFSIEDRQDDNEETNTITNINYKEIATKEGITISVMIPSSVSVTINDDVETYCKNNIQRIIAKNDLPVSNKLYSLEITEDYFNSMIPLYSIDNLNNIYNTLQSCKDTLTKQLTDNNNTDSVIAELQSYNDTYYTRMLNITNEINVKESYIQTIVSYQDAIYSQIISVHKVLNFNEYMKNYSSTVNLLDIFNRYRREDTYKNENIVSTNLESDNASLVQYASYLMNFAEKELIKASTPQMTIVANLYNLLMYPEFEPLLDYFEVGNWIRVRTDINEENEEDSIYKLRLLSYEIEFDKKDGVDVEFSTVTQTWSGLRDIQNIVDSAQTIATSFDSMIKDLEKSTDATKTVTGWVKDGLDLTNQKIVSNANNQDIVIDEHGILARRYDDITESYGDCQLKIFDSGLYTTHDNWKTIDAGVGKFVWKNPTNNWREEETYGIIARKVIGEMILGEEARFINDGGTMSFTENGLSVTNGTNTVNINPNTNALEVLKGSEKQLYIDTDGNINLSGSAKISWNNITDANNIVTTITKDTVDTTYVNALKVTAKEVSSDWVYTNTVTANQVKTGILTATDGTSTIINLNDGTFTFGKGVLTWDGSTLDVNGRIIAKADSKIGGWTIKDAKICGGDSTTGVAVMQIPGGSSGDATWVFAAGGTNHEAYADCKFKVHKNGTLYATNAVIENTLKMQAYDGAQTIPILNLVESSSDTDSLLTNLYIGGTSWTDLNRVYFRYTDVTIAGELDVHGDSISLASSTDYNSERHISTPWKDGSYHDLITAYDNGLGTGVGWSGEGDDGKTYSSYIKLRAQLKTIQMMNGETIDGTLKNGNSVTLLKLGTGENESVNLGNTTQITRLYGESVKLNGTSTDVTSDERAKKDFGSLERFEDFFMTLSPCEFKYLTGTSDRYHIGFGANSVKEALESNNLTTKDFGGYVESEMDKEYYMETLGYLPFESETELSLRYSEFIALNTHMIQKTIKELNNTKAELVDLQAKYDRLVNFINYSD